MNEFLDDIDEAIEAINFIKESLGVSIVLIEEVVGENID